MPNIGPVELIIILVIALIVIGPGRLPDVGAALGKSIREFRKASSDMTEATRVDTSPVPPQAVPAPAISPPAVPAPTPEPASVVPTSPTSSAPVLTTPAAPDDSAGPPA